MKVSRVKSILQRALDQLEEYEDNDNVSLVSNTYFLGDSPCFLGISGYDGGYVDLRDIGEHVYFEDEEED